MRIEPSSRAFVLNTLTDVAKGAVVLDVGGGERFGKWLGEYEHLFSQCDYRTFDYDSSTGADITGDIHAIPAADASVDGVICSSVLEHVINPAIASKELLRVLKPGGRMFLYVPSTYPYHARKGHYPDYWRFFDDTLLELLKGFSSVTLHKRGGYFLALSFFIPFQHKVRFILEPVAEVLDRLFKTEKRSTTAGYFVHAVK